MAANIVYKDIAPYAASDATYSASGASDFSTLELNDRGSGIPYATAELNYWVLDGTRQMLNNNVHFWSAEQSGADGTFSNNPSIAVEFTQQHSSMGVSLYFDTGGNDYCDLLTVTWYQNDVVKSEMDFQPDSAIYFCSNPVTAFDKIAITFKKTALPYRFAKVEQIIFGIVRDFGADEIRSASIVNDMDLLAAELPASSLNLVIDSAEVIDFMFQFKQPIEAYDGTELLGVYYVDFSERKSATVYNVTAYDAIGVLGEQNYPGADHLSGISAKALVAEIVNGAFAVEYDDSVTDITMYGLLERQTKRTALQQVLFAWGVCLRTDGGNTLKIFVPPASDPTVIAENETYNGVSVSTASIVTKVNVIGHTYAQVAEGGNIEINGQQYTDTQTVYTVTNPNVTANDKENVIEVTTATLVSHLNGAEVAQRVYDYYLRRNTHKSKIVYNGQHLGDLVTQPTQWGTSQTGNIQTMTITLSNVVAAQVESVGV